jgi:hypothetical protein
MQDPTDGMPAPEAAAPVNIFSRLGGVYISPGVTFKAIGADARLPMPLFLMIVIGFLQGLFLSRHISYEALVSGASSQGQMPPEQMQFLPAFMKIMTVVSGGIGSLIVVLIVAAVFLLISKIISVENNYKTLLTVTVYAFLATMIVQFLLIFLVISLKGEGMIDPRNLASVIRSSLGAILAGLFGDDILPKFFLRLAYYIDLFAIWRIALLSIGFAAVTRKLKTSTAATWLIILYGIIALIGASFSALSGGISAG